MVYKRTSVFVLWQMGNRLILGMHPLFSVYTKTLRITYKIRVNAVILSRKKQGVRKQEFFPHNLYVSVNFVLLFPKLVYFSIIRWQNHKNKQLITNKPVYNHKGTNQPIGYNIENTGVLYRNFVTVIIRSVFKRWT